MLNINIKKSVIKIGKSCRFEEYPDLFPLKCINVIFVRILVQFTLFRSLNYTENIIFFISKLFQ